MDDVGLVKKIDGESRDDGVRNEVDDSINNNIDDTNDHTIDNININNSNINNEKGKRVKKKESINELNEMVKGLQQRINKVRKNNIMMKEKLIREGTFNEMKIRLKKMKDQLGGKLGQEEWKELLRKLGFEYRDGKVMKKKTKEERVRDGQLALERMGSEIEGLKELLG